MATENVRDDVDARKLGYRFAGYSFQNWGYEGAPPIVVNPAATTHAKLAWCWGEMTQIETMASVLCASENPDVASVGNFLVNKSVSLIAMLEHLADVTA